MTTPVRRAKLVARQAAVTVLIQAGELACRCILQLLSLDLAVAVLVDGVDLTLRIAGRAVFLRPGILAGFRRLGERRVIKIVKKKRELFLGQRLMSLCSLTLP
jgi:hypothetical protein